jgi:Ca-activated chloride channel homolog
MAGGVLLQPSWRSNLRSWLLPVLRGLALSAIIIALARPQQTLQEQDIKADGIDIIMALDLSSSMLAQDFRPDRLRSSQKVAAEFVEHREFDRIGLIVFAAEAFTQCPLTADHEVLNHFLERLQCGQLDDGTAIGMGLATAVNRLKDSQAKSKIIILLTDGVNNAGYIEPNTAAQLAKEFGIKVYTIGVGTTGQAYAPVGRRADGDYVFGFVPVEIDENLLIQIAQQTGGRYFRATDERSLQKIYTEIDQLEKTEMDVTTIQRHLDLYPVWLRWACILLIIEFLLRYTLLRNIF